MWSICEILDIIFTFFMNEAHGSDFLKTNNFDPRGLSLRSCLTHVKVSMNQKQSGNIRGLFFQS